MTTPTYRVDYRNATLYIKCICPSFIEPSLITNWWPVQSTARRDVEHLIGKEARDGGNGEYHVRMGQSAWSGWQTLHLRNGGQTKPDLTEITPIPCPKVRKGIETRYRDGRWEKRLKTKGWVAA